jgi:hypothetical protein
MNLLDVGGRDLSLDLSANYRVRSEDYDKNTGKNRNLADGRARQAN